MMILRTSPPSPYGRKVQLAAAILRLDDRIKIEPADAMDASDSLRQQTHSEKFRFSSPKMHSALRFAGHPRISRSSSRRRPHPSKEPKARFSALRLQALGDGLLDACLLRVYEDAGVIRTPRAEWLAINR